MNPPLKVAIIGGGTGSAAGHAHVTALRMDGSFHIQGAMFSRNAESNINSCAKYLLDESIIYTDLDQLKENTQKQVDLYCVLTDTPSHLSILQSLVDTGKPIICEKPLVSSVSQAQQLVSTPEFSNSSIYVISNYVCYPMMSLMKSLIPDIGNIRLVELNMPQDGFARAAFQNRLASIQDWRLTDGDVTGISLDLGVHLLYIFNFLTGDSVVPLSGVRTSSSAHTPVADICIAQCYSKHSKYPVVLRYGKAWHGYKNGLSVNIVGTDGSLEWKQSNPEIIKLSRGDGSMTLLDRSSQNYLDKQYCSIDRFKVGHPSGFVEALANNYLMISDYVSVPQKSTYPLETYKYTAQKAISDIADLSLIESKTIAI